MIISSLLRVAPAQSDRTLAKLSGAADRLMRDGQT